MHVKVDTLKFSIRDSKHDLLYKTLRPLATGLVKRQVQKALQDAVRTGLEYVDGQLVTVRDRMDEAKADENQSRTQALQEVRIISTINILRCMEAHVDDSCSSARRTKRRTRHQKRTRRRERSRLWRSATRRSCRTSGGATDGRTERRSARTLLWRVRRGTRRRSQSSETALLSTCANIWG